MLTVSGSAGSTFCDRVSRRSFLQIGGLALGGMSLPHLMQAQAAASNGRKQKSVIMIFLAGGPPHQDMFDLKPDAPSEIRGEFDPIETSIPGIQISELFPRVAASMDRYAIIRSLVGSEGRHDSYECCTGRQFKSPKPQGGWPSIGSVLSRVEGQVHPAVPAFVDVSRKMAHDPWNIKGPGFLGMAHAPFRPDGESLLNMTLDEASSLRFDGRASLLSQLDRFRRIADAKVAQNLYDDMTEQALGVLTSPRLVEALDLERESPETRARYGKDIMDFQGYSPDKGYQAMTSPFLQARRLVEAGVRCVTCSFAHFDWHGNNFKSAREIIPLLDQGVSALVDDLHERGLDEDVSVIVWGEFGRTPKINDRAGRDHWPGVHSALLAGGGMRCGQVIGSTNRLAEEAVDRPVHMQEVLATLYHNLGIDTSRVSIPDNSGRPQYLVDQYQAVAELV